jgi:nucleotide-binding universal stress UspA family protein
MSKHILVAVGAQRHDAVLKTAIDNARRMNAQLTAVYVVDEMPWWAMTGVEYGCISGLQMVQELERAVEQRCTDTFARDAQDLQTRAVAIPMQGSSVARTIARFADELDADLIVVGAGRPSKWRFWEERMSDGIGRCTRRAVMVATSAEAQAAGQDQRDVQREVQRDVQRDIQREAPHEVQRDAHREAQRRPRVAVRTQAL